MCGTASGKLRHQGVRDNTLIDVLECSECGLVYLSSFDHISDDYYEQSMMLGGVVDLDQYRLRSLNDDTRRLTTIKEEAIDKTILDFGCGGGGFLSMIKPFVQCAAGVELDNTIRNSLRQEGLQVFASIDEIEGQYDYITLFHVLEHLPDPAAILGRLKNHLSPKGKIIIEVPSANDALLKLYGSDKFAKFTYWSCHLFLFTPETLTKTAINAGFKVKYVKQVQRYPLSNHLHWLAEQRPGGHQEWSFLNDVQLNQAYEKQLASIGMCDTLFTCLMIDDVK
ncbi:class I SAM-dependent methyltransferase [Paenibacillus spongiae]|uniref:Class I SAM-dependent methyltransferase n=1 Tax=Paenibacillus spongiae TaxID=2909671 RepID=A0ABY5SB04_9BACL|nr:class I SAM-dependent methyltransferase [Paenibacillus spongiae]UVI29883.1 class I SAM-dependent methyltransferase [Paenibacillus spongiae]